MKTNAQRSIVKVARLQSEFWRQIFFPSYEFSFEKFSEIFPEIVVPLFCGSEKSPAKVPPNLPPNSPVKNQTSY